MFAKLAAKLLIALNYKKFLAAKQRIHGTGAVTSSRDTDVFKRIASNSQKLDMNLSKYKKQKFVDKLPTKNFKRLD